MHTDNVVMCNSFKILGLLLCYPSQELIAELPILLSRLSEEKLVNDKDLQNLTKLIDYLSNTELLTLQEKYVELFDRNKSLSLHLFEHVHGDSRERGEAMVSLLEMYTAYEYSAIENELPDYLPLFLEFLSCIPKDDAISMLADPEHILLTIGKRLKSYGSAYNIVFVVLLNLIKKDLGKNINIILNNESKSGAVADLDEEWGEEPVEFMGATTNSCGNKAKSCKCSKE